VGLKLNGIYQYLTYANDVNLQGYNIITLKKNTEILIDVSRDAGLEVNVEKSKHMLLSRHQHAGQHVT
jgi:hypothetical protein